MLIRTGILCVPQRDEDAVQLVRNRLRQTIPGVQVMSESNAASQRHWIEETLRRWCDEDELDLVLTIGGTMPAPGPSMQEIVPEATLAVVERLLPGLSEEMRAYAREQQLLALLDRGVAGIRSRSLIINLPAGAALAALFLEAIVELIEPIMAYLQDRADVPSLTDRFVPIGNNENPTQPDVTVESPPVSGPAKLSAEEFRAFLQRRTPSES